MRGFQRRRAQSSKQRLTKKDPFDMNADIAKGIVEASRSFLLGYSGTSCLSPIDKALKMGSKAKGKSEVR